MIIRPGQIILLAAVIAFAIYATRVRSSLSDRLIYIALVAIGVPLVLYPDWSTALAHRVGIGRGVDLVIYLFMAYCLFFFASSASHFRKIERDLTLVVRALAIERAVARPTDGGAAGAPEAAPDPAAPRHGEPPPS
jgi:hypothetical protein